EGALALLDQNKSEESRLWHEHRADCLERLGRKPEADQARMDAAQFAPNRATATFLTGIDRLRRQDLSGALGCFDELLAAEPNHFMARFFQAVCHLRQKRATAAKVGLTACLGQRPRFAWTYLLRAEAAVQLEHHAAALRDLQSGLDLKAGAAGKAALLTARGYFYLRRKQWAQARADFDQAQRLGPGAPE